MSLCSHALQPIRRRVVAVADLHGDLANAMRVLRMAEVVDHRGAWIASPSTVLVQTGDVVDRGTDTIALYRLFAALTDGAAAVGASVVRLLGNHEYAVASYLRIEGGGLSGPADS